MYHIFILLRKKSENKGFILLKRIQKAVDMIHSFLNVSFLLPMYQLCCCRSSYAVPSIYLPLV